ncbi:MAG: hypothetical protein ACYSU7_06840 [Planctomycetota bacterium]
MPPTADVTKPTAAAASPPTDDPRGDTGGERALLGRGPWWWKASLAKTTPGAPDAASYRRYHADEPEAPEVEPESPMPTVSRIPAVIGSDADADPPEVTDLDALETHEPQVPPEAPDLPEAPDVAGIPEAAEVLETAEVPETGEAPPNDEAPEVPEAPVAEEETDLAEPPELAAAPDPSETEPAEPELPVEVPEAPHDETVEIDEAVELDEVMEAIKALEAPDPPAVIEEPQPMEAPAPEPKPVSGVRDDALIDPQPDPEPELEAEPDHEPVPLPPSVEDALRAATDEDAAAPEPAIPAQSLEQLDDELAEDVDKMLQGEFESVDELLEGGFDEPEPVEDQTGAAAEASTETGVVSEIAVATRVEEAPEAPAEAKESDGIVDPADFIDGIGGKPGAESAPEPDPVPASQTVDEDPPEPVEETEPTPDPKDEPVVAAAGSARARARPRAKPPLIQILEWANSPRRHLPATARVVVDWVALSLVFWVPIVWLFALFVAG